MSRISLLIGAGVGYVLGTRAGREKYDKMAAEAQKLWRDPRVQKKTKQAQHAADDMAHKAEDKVTSKVEEHSGNSSDSPGGPTSSGGFSAGGPRA